MTDAELAILHLLAEKPRHGYEIDEVIEQRGMRQWSAIGFSSIYYLLNRLEETGMVAKQVAESERGSARKVFSITGEGFAALRAGTLESLADPQGDYRSLMTGLANLPYVTREEALDALARHRDGLAERRQQAAGRAEAQQPLSDHVAMLFDYSFTMMDIRLKWITTLIADIERGRFDWWDETGDRHTSRSL
jgi:DNA-binding PadR family transcriptional regulator